MTESIKLGTKPAEKECRRGDGNERKRSEASTRGSRLQLLLEPGRLIPYSRRRRTTGPSRGGDELDIRQQRAGIVVVELIRLAWSFILATAIAVGRLGAAAELGDAEGGEIGGVGHRLLRGAIARAQR